MLFFDDEQRNKIVESTFGVTFCCVEDGMTVEKFDQGVQKWRKQQNVKALPQESKGRPQKGIPN